MQASYIFLEALTQKTSNLMYQSSPHNFDKVSLVSALLAINEEVACIREHVALVVADHRAVSAGNSDKTSVALPAIAEAEEREDDRVSDSG